MIMNYTFQFPEPTFGSTYVAVGDKCEFSAGEPFNASQLAGGTDPIMTDTVDSRYQATFTNPTGRDNVAIVLKNGGKTYARSNSIDLSQFSPSGTNRIYVTPMEKLLTLTELRGFVPATPFTQDNVKVTSATLSLSGGNLKVSGKAESDGWWFFDFTLEFEYTFSLQPVKNPVWVLENVQLLVVEKEDFKLTGKGILQDVLLVFAKGTIRKKFEERLQTELDAVIDDQLSALPDYSATISTVTVGSSSVTLKIYLVGTRSLCAFATSPPASMGSKARTKAEVNKMHAIRDTVLKPSVKGQAYVAALDKHKLELSRILSGSPAAANSFHAALGAFLAENAKTRANPTLSEKSIAAAKTAIAEIRTLASPVLRASLDQLGKDLSSAKPGVLTEFFGGKSGGKA
jgi:hypothetical protein